MTNQDAATSGDARTPRALLVEWANDHDGWARLVVSEVLSTRRPLSGTELDRIYESYKAEKGLSDAVAAPSPKLEIDDNGGKEETVLVLRSLDEVEGVNALGAGNKIDFNEHLTVLFGENGAGKTGYSRILKRAAKVRTAEEILPNAHATSPQPSPKARLRYSLGSKAAETTWQNEEGVSPFSRLSVFDWLSVSVHLDDELGYVYTPADLALFSYISDGIEGVQSHLAKEIEDLRPGPNPFLRHFKRGTSTYPLIESLGAASDLDVLGKVSKVTPREKERREQLLEEVAALRGRTIDDQIFAASERAKSLRLLSNVAKRSASFEAAAYETARKALELARKEHEHARTKLFDRDELPGPPDDHWQELIAAADAYLRHQGLEEYPGDGDRCIYCRQQLSVSALDLVRRYRTFLDDSLARQLTSATALMAERALTVDGLDLPAVERFLQLQIEQGSSEDWVKVATGVVGRVLGIAEGTANGDAVAADGFSDDAGRLVKSLAKLVADATSNETELKLRKTDRSKVLGEKEEELAELEARIELSKQLASVTSYVEEAKAYERFQALSGRLPNVKKSLTEVAKVASQDLVNSSFRDLFAEEREALRAPVVELHFQGRRGQAERRKTVAASYRPSEILSEGEQKVLALADFLAECRMRGSRAPIVFDDPVTSLDYRRLREVAERVAKLADTHQVIVFTHNIWFTTELLTFFEKRKEQVTYYSVRDSEDAKGIIAGGESPRQDNPKAIGKRIDEVIGAAKKADPPAQDALIEKGYDLLRSWIEAFVEQEMLAGITERYRPNIMMGRLSRLKPDLLADAIEELIPMFNKACRYMGGHSQPLEQLSVRPSATDLDADWARLQEIRKDFT